MLLVIIHAYEDHINSYSLPQIEGIACPRAINESEVVFNLFKKFAWLVIVYRQSFSKTNPSLLLHENWNLEKKKLCYEMTKTTSYYLIFFNTYNSTTSNNSCLWRPYKLRLPPPDRRYDTSSCHEWINTGLE